MQYQRNTTRERRGHMTDTFSPGDFWTPERARIAVDRMAASMASPEMQTMMQAIASGAAENGNAAAMAASMAGATPAPKSTAPIAAGACTYRRGRASDLPEFARLIVAGELPPMFIEEFVEGFVAVEHEDELIGCGGLEIYGESGVVRSVVVDERGRGQHIGERISELLLQDARASGAADVYLFTMHAYNFWRRQGFADAPLDTWPDPTRVCWQYQFITQFPEVSTGVYPMARIARA